MLGESFSDTTHVLDEVLRVTVGNIQADEAEIWNSFDDLLQFIEIAFSRTAGHGYKTQSVFVLELEIQIAFQKHYSGMEVVSNQQNNI